MSDQQNPYQAPQSDLSRPEMIEGGSIEATLAGKASLDVGVVLGEAWDRLKGSKRILLGGFLLIYLAMFVVIGGLGVLLGLNSADPGKSILWQLIIQLVALAIIYPFMAGVILTAARHMAGQPIAFADLFANYGNPAKLVGAGLLVQLLTMIGFVLFIIPGIYLSVAYVLTGALVAERNMGVWEAMEASRKIVTKHWLSVFAIGLVVGFAMGVSALFLAIPLIWTMPWGLLCLGVVYRNLAGVIAR